MKNILKILLIDDEADICWLVEKALEDTGHKITKTTTGKGGIVEAKRSTFAGVFIDIKLTDINGFEVARTIKKIMPQTKVIMITGYTSDSNELMKKHKGSYDDFISKPFDLTQIYATINEIARRN
jgi:DNA-binding response OmpR family regulator